MVLKTGSTIPGANILNDTRNKVIVRDFTIMGVSPTRPFVQSENDSDVFHAWISSLSGSVITKDNESILTTGMHNIVNQ